MFLRLRRFKTGSKNNLHLLHEAHKHSWSTDPLHSIADMRSRGDVSKFLFTHYHDKANYVEMINSITRAVLSTFTDADVEDCDTNREVLSEISTHGMRAAVVIHAFCNRDIKKDWTDQRAGLESRDRPTTSEVSYDLIQLTCLLHELIWIGEMPKMVEAVQYFLKLSQLKIALISLDWRT